MQILINVFMSLRFARHNCICDIVGKYMVNLVRTVREERQVLVSSITKTSLIKYTENITTKNDSFQIKILIFFIFLLNIDCGYSLEPPRRGSSNETHNLCF